MAQISHRKFNRRDKKKRQQHKQQHKQTITTTVRNNNNNSKKHTHQKHSHPLRIIYLFIFFSLFHAMYTHIAFVYFDNKSFTNQTQLLLTKQTRFFFQTNKSHATTHSLYSLTATLLILTFS